MSSFYHCYTPLSSHKGYPTVTPSTPVQDLKSALDCIKKASLAVSDLSLKLQLKQVTNFLESNIVSKSKQDITQSISSQKLKSIIPNDPDNCLESNICVCLPSYEKSLQKPRMDNISIAIKKPERVYPFEDNIQCETAKSLLLGKISQSAVSKELMESNMREPSQTQTLGQLQIRRENSYKDKQNSQQEQIKEQQWKISSSQGLSGFGKALKWRSVVTRNVLEQHDTNKRVYFASENGKIDQSQVFNKMNSQKLQQENKQLRQGLLEILSCLQHKQPINYQINLPIEQLLDRVHRCCEQLSDSVSSQCHQISMKSLKKSEQQISQQAKEQRGYLQKVRVQMQEMKSETQKISEQLDKSRMECEKLRELARTRAEEIKKYQLLLFVKEEELAALKVMVQSQDKKSNSSVPTSPSGRTYKKYFQHLENNFTAMNNLSSTN